MIDTQTIALLRELLAKATPGEWLVMPGGFGKYNQPHVSSVYFPGETLCYIARCGDCFMPHDAELSGHNPPADAELIAAAVNALPALLDRLEELEREVEKSKEPDYYWDVDDPESTNDDLEELLRYKTECCPEHTREEILVTLGCAKDLGVKGYVVKWVDEYDIEYWEANP
jgi:hypothetical protein